MSNTFKVLTLDGGGSRGVYSLGVLFELEKKLGKPLVECFDAFFGSSTGAIIAALLSLGYTTEQISKIYLEKIPYVMGAWTRFGRTKRLSRMLDEVLGDKGFDQFKKYTGIVTASVDELRPKVFKSSVDGAHGRKSSFAAGFGRPIKDAVLASCAAYPLFQPVHIKSETSHFELIDGGFTANNPTLFAIIDALSAFNIPRDKVRVLNVGTGSFPECLPKSTALWATVFAPIRKFISTILNLNSATLDTITKLLLKDIKVVRVSETFSEPSLRTNLLENSPTKLKRLYERGRQSFGNQESEITALFEHETAPPMASNTI